MELMGALARDATVATPAVSGCALTLSTATIALEPGAYVAVPIRAGSDAFALAMESIQDQIGEGPTMAARTAGVAVAVTDVQAEVARWPVFAMAARAHGLLAVHAQPLITPDGRQWGSISWYAKAPGTFRGGAHGLVARAGEVAATLALARRFLCLQVRPVDLFAALASRAVISQAAGIVMQRQGCDADTAFAELRETARREHTGLPIAAALLVDRAARGHRADRALTASRTVRRVEEIS